MPQYLHLQKPPQAAGKGNSMPIGAPDFSYQPEELKGWLNSGLRNRTQPKTPTWVIVKAITEVSEFAFQAPRKKNHISLGIVPQTNTNSTAITPTPPKNQAFRYWNSSWAQLYIRSSPLPHKALQSTDTDHPTPINIRLFSQEKQGLPSQHALIAWKHNKLCHFLTVKSDSATGEPKLVSKWDFPFQGSRTRAWAGTATQGHNTIAEGSSFLFMF